MRSLRFPAATRVIRAAAALGLLCFVAAFSARADEAVSDPGLRARPDPRFTAFFERTNGWVAGDGAISIPLSKQRVLWLFGDSHLDDLDRKSGTMACLFQCRNAALLQTSRDSLRADTLCGRGPGFRSWLKNSTNDDQWLWPMCGFESGKFVYIYTAALRKTKSTGPFAFESAGHDFWAKVRLPGLEKIEYLPLPSFRGIGFGNGFVRRGGRIYAFGSKQNGLGADVFVASFPTGSPEAAWKFWDGKTWVRGVWKAEPVARAVSTSVQVCELKGTIVISTSALSLGCDQGKDIFVLTSRSLTGPFSSPRKIYEIPDRREGHSPFFYFPILHSEFINSKKEVLLTYSINNYEPCVPSCSKGRAIPDDYRPRAVRVPLEMILKSKGQP